MPKFKKPYDDHGPASKRTGLACKDKSLTQQNFKDDSDINVIVKRFGLTGQLPVGLRVPTYGDFDQVDDYRTALEIVKAADYAFQQLPPDIRARFNNDPHEFVAFAEDPTNIEEMRKMGLAIPRESPLEVSPKPATPPA